MSGNTPSRSCATWKTCRSKQRRGLGRVSCYPVEGARAANLGHPYSPYIPYEQLGVGWSCERSFPTICFRRKTWRDLLRGGMWQKNGGKTIGSLMGFTSFHGIWWDFLWNLVIHPLVDPYLANWKIREVHPICLSTVQRDRQHPLVWHWAFASARAIGMLGLNSRGWYASVHAYIPTYIPTYLHPYIHTYVCTLHCINYI